METHRLNELINILPLEKYNEVINFIEFLLTRTEPELLLDERDELRYFELLRSDERVKAEDAEKRLLGYGVNE